MPRFNWGGARKGKWQGQKEGEERESRRNDGRKGRKEGMGNLDGGDCATAPRGG